MIGDRWGATVEEVAARHPCDALVPAGAVRADRAISVAAPVGLVFRWLCQLRAAPYSYDWLDNRGRRSPAELTLGLDDLRAGQRFMTLFRLACFAPGEHLTLRSGHATAVTYATRPQAAGTRLAVRVALALPRWAAAPLVAGDLIMMRRQLLTLRALAERDAAA
ncbi:hypothetical protein FSW04_18795 [Baekduia soli]|uniref:SRPBCC family protein n=1 Tax=Baekduia soli TaxID=496014 RepID=A0A5B8U8Y3_9ACTN|nr:hypothetical protein [Baekduia soli]QEC49417.1 hypothetical protein FSW04_18795 [Baekduia soli]